MKKPVVALVGRPNVGKSTIFNRIIGKKIAIIEDTPGVTRDRLYGSATYLKHSFYLIDTGGIYSGEDAFNAEIKVQVELAIDEADVVVFVVDGKEGLAKDDYTVKTMLQKSGKKVIVAINKVDSKESREHLYDFYELGFDEYICVSGEQNTGICDLLDKVCEDFKEIEEEYDEDTIKFSVIGRPNVGKSSLVNAILGETRVIVSNVAGTTRDSIDMPFRYHDNDYVVIDTAGMRKRGKVYENIEKYSLLRSMRAIDRSDVCLLVINAEEGIIEHDKHIASYALEAGKSIVIVINKWDKIKEKDHKTKEILLNLLYMDVETPLLEWLNLAEEYTKTGEKFRLYQMLGNSVTYLCGIRDLSALFACSKREEKQRGILWKGAFGDAEWECYRLAKMDYYLETDRKDSIGMDEWALLQKDTGTENIWQLRVAKLYLLCKLQRMQPEKERIDQIRLLEASLKKETSSVCRIITESIGSLYAPWLGERERMSRWLRFAVMDSTVAVNEENYLLFYCRAKGYILLNQYERAEKILKKLVPYLQEYHRYRLMAEALFQSAVVHWSKELRGQAVKNAIESMGVTGGSRYVIFYAAYGQKGLQVLEDYEEWMRSNAPEGWSSKKKYNYGNVLRMPVEDYVQAVLRCAKKALKEEGVFDTEQVQEHLTMMETIVLQSLGMGKSNAQICQELGLKLPTVKGHAYSLFKKLGVNSRTQAVIKGKEMGILE